MLAENGFLALDLGRVDLIAGDTSRIGRRDMKGDVFDQLAKILVLGHKVGLAIDLDQDPDFTLQVNVGGHDTFLGAARGLLSG